MEKLTEKQERIYDYIVSFIKSNGYPPTIREIGDEFGIHSTNGVTEHLKALERKGWIEKKSGLNRTIMPREFIEQGEGVEVSRSSEVNSNIVPIPLLGRIAAGEPALAEEQIEATVYFDSYLLGRQKNIFLLRVRGDSMIGEGIFDGDYVIIKSQSNAENGNLVAVLIGDSATVKRFYKEKDVIKLVPANEAYKPIIIEKSKFDSTLILGVVVGLYRRYR